MTYTEARNNLKSVLDSTVEDGDVIVIMRRDRENAVVMSETQYASLMETLHLLMQLPSPELLNKIRLDKLYRVVLLTYSSSNEYQLCAGSVGAIYLLAGSGSKNA